jgi:two-component system, cell cycle sensor histidine kinase and response regulator CckA
MSQQIQILIVEDNPVDAELLVRELRRSGIYFDWQRVDSEVEYLSKLSPKLHLILSDFEMPEFNGLRALALLKEQPTLDIPFIIVSGTIGEEMAVAAMREGAADYLLKDRICRLGPAVSRALHEVEERNERKRLEAQFIEAQKMEVVGQLAGGVAHDFNNVLGVIIGYSDLLVEDPGTDRLVQYVEEIRLAAERAAGLTSQLLVFSRKQTVQAVDLDLNKVVEGMEKMLRRLIDENVEMTVVYGDKIGTVKADSGYVWQVLMNLVVNARDAMPNGGKLAIQTSGVLLEEAYAQSHPGTTPGNYVMLSISDTGTGMTEEVKAHLFEAFFTTKPVGKGTGLGLITCQAVVRQSGGHIDVSSELGKGTTFKIYFPRIEQSARAATQPLPKIGALKRGTETLLVVEDEPSLRHLAEGVLKAQGYKVLTAPNGQDALRVADEHQGKPIALVVTDVIMPRMGGKAMAEWLQTTSPDLKILFTSGYTEDAIVHHGVLDEGIEFLPKPYTPATLARKVRELLDNPVTAGGTI